MSVDLPAPFAPTTPSTEPRGTWKETCLSASTSRTTRSRRPSRLTVDLNVGLRSSDVLYVTETSWTRMELPSESDSELTLPGDEEEEADGEQAERPGAAHGELGRGGR